MKATAILGIIAIMVVLYAFSREQGQSESSIQFTTPDLSFLKDRKAPPPFQWTDGEGKEVTLAHYQGQVVLVSLWAHWCFPCLTELPLLDDLDERVSQPDFQVVALNVDTDPEQLRLAQEFLEDQELLLSSPFLIRKSGDVLPEWAKEPIPRHYLIDRQGHVAWQAIGAIDWSRPEIEDFLQKALHQGSNESNLPSLPVESTDDNS